jgi:hypothetical protein
MINKKMETLINKPVTKKIVTDPHILTMKNSVADVEIMYFKYFLENRNQVLILKTNFHSLFLVMLFFCLWATELQWFGSVTNRFCYWCECMLQE